MVGAGVEVAPQQATRAAGQGAACAAGYGEPVFAGAVIVTESGSDLAPGEADRLGIHVLPMHVDLEGSDRLDGPLLAQEVFDSYRRTGVPPKTSATSPGEYWQLFKSLREQHPGKYILHVSYSAATTATYDNALLGGAGIPGIIHVDAKAASSTLGAVAMSMARYAAEHPSATHDELVRAAEGAVGRARLAFVPSDLAFLRAGGRLTNAAYLGASLLKISPVIEMLDGKLVCTQKKRGSFARTCRDVLAAKLSEERFDPESFFLLESSALDADLKRELEGIVRAAGYQDVAWRTTQGVISCHCGPTTFGFGGLAAG